MQEFTKGKIMSQTIFLGGRTHPITVSDEGYEAIVALVTAQRVCTNGCAYTADNPMVTENTCLSCLVNRQSYLRFVGPLGDPDEDGYQQFKFLTEKGNVYLTSTRHDYAAQQDTYQTLVHWGFGVPAVYRPPRGEEVKLYPHSWTVYGNLFSSVVVIEKSYDQKHPATFLSYTNGTFRELTKRDADMKRLLEEATDILEESKGEDGSYQYEGTSSNRIRDSWVYEVVSLIAAAVYDVKVRLTASLKTEQSTDQEAIAS